jgi:cytochrome oxidase assembly protein ShyY1
VTRLVTVQAADLIGYIRFPEKPGMLTPAENTAKRLWFARDTFEMSRALGWGAVAPFYIDLEQPLPASGIPSPGPLQVHLKDDHLQYAITWFALAGALVVAFFIWWRGKRRDAT